MKSYKPTMSHLTKEGEGQDLAAAFFFFNEKARMEKEY